MTRGWWATHSYARRSVARDVDQFAGWEALMGLVGAAETPLEEAFLSALFLTGGRVSEVLMLVKANFEDLGEDGLVLEKKMDINGLGDEKDGVL